ncbi:MAG: hypothetical protein R6U78_12970 [Bacteroidales bacterium]
MKTAGIIFMSAGIIGLIYFGYQAISQSETLSLFGIDIAVSSANWTPVIISGVVTLGGIIMASAGRRRNR